jgi:sigma-B regulation protein RsbU (phosphoserine phosphatase)
MRILIAEDERITRATLERHLRHWGHDVVATEDGAQAWAAFEAGDFDMVITDWEMPHLSGVELVTRIRATSRVLYTYVIIVTSRSDKADVVAGIGAGADDFVTKPFDRDELRVRVMAGERVVHLERTLHRQNADLQQANDRIRSGLRAAARVQQSMLPQRHIETPGVRAAWKYAPCDELAGDAIGLHLLDDRFLVAYVIDVSGHGVPAALLSVSAMHAMEPSQADSSALRDLTPTNPALGTLRTPSEVAAELNRRFRAGENGGLYLTMLLGILDTHGGRLHMTCAGHPAPLVLRDSQPLALPTMGGFPIAMLDFASYDEHVLELQPGDRVCVFSDGLPDQENAAGEPFGSARVIDTAVACRDASPGDTAEALVGALRAWSGGGSFADDVSLVVFDWLGDGADLR